MVLTSAFSATVLSKEDSELGSNHSSGSLGATRTAFFEDRHHTVELVDRPFSPFSSESLAAGTRPPRCYRDLQSP